MKRFILQSAVFVAPFLALYFFSIIFYTTTRGDLLRLGYIVDNFRYDETKVFNTELHNKTLFKKISGINLYDTNKATVLTIGDSFSELDSVSYQNYLSDNMNVSVLHYDRFLHENPIQTLEGILNGNLLDKIKVKYIVLESVERDFINRVKNVDTEKIITADSIKNMILARDLRKSVTEAQDGFFCKTVLKFPLKAIDYQFDDNAFDSPSYIANTTKYLFSIDRKELLFYFEDVESVRANNSLPDIERLNLTLNGFSAKLKKKGIKLIVLPCPDKYDLYYSYIVEKEKYPKPLFFENFRHLQKQYLYIDSKHILEEAVKTQKDIYLFDDTHWSPWAAKLIAKEIYRILGHTTETYKQL